MPLALLQAESTITAITGLIQALGGVGPIALTLILGAALCSLPFVMLWLIVKGQGKVVERQAIALESVGQALSDVAQALIKVEDKLEEHARLHAETNSKLNAQSKDIALIKDRLPRSDAHAAGGGK